MFKVTYADRKSTFYTQKNNPIDVYNRLTWKPDYYESCMCSAITNSCMALLDKELTFKINGVNFQPEQLGWDMLNDKDNWPELQKYRALSEETLLEESIIPSRVPQYMPFVIEKLFNMKGKFIWVDPAKVFDTYADNVIQNMPSIIQFLNPEHYVTILKYDPNKELLYYHDSVHGPNKVLTRKDVESNTACYYVVVWKE